MQNNLKRNVLLIAIILFAISTSTVFYLQDSDNLGVEGEDLQTFVLQDSEEGTNPLSEEEYRDLIGNDEDEFAIVNINRTFRYLSKELSDVHGYSEEEISELNVLTFIHPKDLPEFTTSLMQYHNTGISMSNIGPLRVKTKSGEYVPYVVSLIPLKNEDNIRTGTVVVFKNISQPLGEKNKDQSASNSANGKEAKGKADAIKNDKYGIGGSANKSEIAADAGNETLINEATISGIAEEESTGEPRGNDKEKNNSEHGNNKEKGDSSNPGRLKKELKSNSEDPSDSLDGESSLNNI